MTQHQKTIKERDNATCPVCKTDMYVRGALEPEDDIITCNCKCENGHEFIEVFVLKYQEWED